MFIQTELTPNPAVIKFLPGQTVLPQGTASFENAGQAGNSPLAMRLFGVAGVGGVFLGQDFVSVTKEDNTDWSMLKPMVLAVLMEHLATGQPVMAGEARASGNEIQDDDDEIVVQIKQLIEERVRPAVARDGGDIVFESFENGIVYLQMRGACAGCPSSTMTLKSGIENMLKHFVPEVLEVRSTL
jgi:Fe-S cluster biogenesis protein NfuA